MQMKFELAGLSKAPPPARHACKASSSFDRVKSALTAVICNFLSDLWRAIASTIVWIPRRSSDRKEDPRREMMRMAWQSKSALAQGNCFAFTLLVPRASVASSSSKKNRLDLMCFSATNMMQHGRIPFTT